MNTLKVLVVLIGALLLLTSGEKFLNKSEHKKEEITIKKESVKPSISASPTKPTPSPKPDMEIAAPSLSPTTVPQTSSFIYPNSVIIKNSGNYIELQSGDDPDVITGWYKDQMSSSLFNARSFVATKTNGNVLNKLSADGSSKLEVEVKKEQGNSITRISVSL